MCRRLAGPQGQEGPALRLILCSCSLEILFLSLSFLNWGIIASQCASFCCTTKLISHTYTYVPSLLSLPPAHALIPPLQSSETQRSSLCGAAASKQLFHTWECACQSSSLSSSHPPLFLLCPHICSLCLRLYSCPANRFVCTMFFS